MQITILNTPIRQTADGLFCVNDLHKAAGGAKKDKPSNWLRLESTKGIVRELESERNQVLTSEDLSINRHLRVVSGSPESGGGAFVARELVYAYAMWISPKFHLQVIRTFDAHVQAQIAALAQDATSYQAIAMSSDDLLISDAAIILKVKQKEFFTFLSKGLGWIYKRGSIWRPKQKAVEDGFVARRCSKYFKDGEEKRSYQTVITEMGMTFAQRRRLALV